MILLFISSNTYFTLISLVVKVPVLSKHATSIYPEIWILSILLPIILLFFKRSNAIVAVNEKKIGIAGGNIQVKVLNIFAKINSVV